MSRRRRLTTLFSPSVVFLGALPVRSTSRKKSAGGLRGGGRYGAVANSEGCETEQGTAPALVELDPAGTDRR